MTTRRASSNMWRATRRRYFHSEGRRGVIHGEQRGHIMLGPRSAKRLQRALQAANAPRHSTHVQAVALSLLALAVGSLVAAALWAWLHP